MSLRAAPAAQPPYRVSLLFAPHSTTTDNTPPSSPRPSPGTTHPLQAPLIPHCHFAICSMTYGLGILIMALQAATTDESWHPRANPFAIPDPMNRSFHRRGDGAPARGKDLSRSQKDFPIQTLLFGEQGLESILQALVVPKDATQSKDQKQTPQRHPQPSSTETTSVLKGQGPLNKGCPDPMLRGPSKCPVLGSWTDVPISTKPTHPAPPRFEKKQLLTTAGPPSR